MQELIVIFVVALVVFGPKRLPELGRTLGKGLNELKKSMSGLKEQIDDEMKDIKDIKDRVSGEISSLKPDELLKNERVDTGNEKTAEEPTTDDEGEKKEKEVDG